MTNLLTTATILITTNWFVVQGLGIARDKVEIGVVEKHVVGHVHYGTNIHNVVVESQKLDILWRTNYVSTNLFFELQEQSSKLYRNPSEGPRIIIPMPKIRPD